MGASLEAATVCNTLNGDPGRFPPPPDAGHREFLEDLLTYPPRSAARDASYGDNDYVNLDSVYVRPGARVRSEPRVGAGDRPASYDRYGLNPEESGAVERALGCSGSGGTCMHAPGDELQDLLARLTSRAHELEPRAIYRGERKWFPRISSGLYRHFHEIDDQRFDIRAAQRRWIERARQYAPYLTDDEILTHLQHLGGKTNLIDFTRDLNIALFFASYQSHDKDGRVILMRQPLVSRNQRQMPTSYRLVPRGAPANMTDVQKSVWVEPRNGYIDDEDVTVIEIPSALKPEILSYLRVAHAIEASTVYNDLSGFIRDQDRLCDPEAEWHAGVRAAEEGRHECALGFFARYEGLVGAPRVDLEYRRAISHWHTERRREALAAMSRFRSRSPNSSRAFPEVMESAYAEGRRQEVVGRLRTDGDAVPRQTEVFPGFRIELVGDAPGPSRTRLEIHDEFGNGRELALDEKETFVAFPGLMPEAGRTWLLSLNRHDYRGVDSQPMRWPVRETLILKAIDGDARGITVEIESLQYTYEAGIEGPLVTYPARSDGGSTG